MQKQSRKANVAKLKRNKKPRETETGILRKLIQPSGMASAGECRGNNVLRESLE